MKFCKRCGVETERGANGRCKPCRRNDGRRQYAASAARGPIVKFCNNCGVETERYTGGKCKPCSRKNASVRYALNPARYREKGDRYRRENIEAVRARDRDRYVKNRLAVLQRLRSYYGNNRYLVLGRNRTWRKRNIEMVRQSVRKYREANPEKCREWARRRRANNPRKNAGNQARYRAQKLRQTCVCCRPEDFREVYARARKDRLHVDHIVPLVIGGLHCLKNIQLLTPEEHKVKSVRDIPLIVSAGRGPSSWKAVAP